MLPSAGDGENCTLISPLLRRNPKLRKERKLREAGGSLQLSKNVGQDTSFAAVSQSDQGWGQERTWRRKNVCDAPKDIRKRGVARGGRRLPPPTHTQTHKHGEGKSLTESVCRRDKDSGRAGAGSLERFPDNAQNLAKMNNSWG